MEEVKYIPGDLITSEKNPNTIWKIEEVIPNKYWGALYKTVDARNNIYCTNLYKYQVVPIPLTLEILEKNGWKKKVMSRRILNSHWVYTKPDIEEYGYFPIYIEKGIGKEFDVYPFTHNNSCTQITYIKYVHELQHLLFGLGLNSEMEV